MTNSPNCAALIKVFEPLREVAFWNAAEKKYEIGYGSNSYQSGLFVRMEELITKDKAEELLDWHIARDAQMLNRRVSHIELKQYQFDALVSLLNDIGPKRFFDSLLFKTVLVNPNDLYITTCFRMLHRTRDPAVQEKAMKSIKFKYDSAKNTRRHREAAHYFDRHKNYVTPRNAKKIL